MSPDNSRHPRGEPQAEGGVDAMAIRRPVAYIRLYADADGRSCFEDVRLPGEARGVVESDLMAVFSEPFRADAVMFRHVIKEADGTRPHNAPRRQFIVQLTGECEIEASNGETRRLVPGSVLLVEDVDGEGHITRRVGDDLRLTLIIPLVDR
jgi:quercetin dioxygenase-like cupin family protein